MDINFWCEMEKQLEKINLIEHNMQLKEYEYPADIKEEEYFEIKIYMKIEIEISKKSLKSKEIEEIEEHLNYMNNRIEKHYLEKNEFNIS